MRHCLAKIKVETKSADSVTTYGSNLRLFNLLLDACHAVGLRVMASKCHEFYPQGLTAFVVLGESHVAIHTYPEDGLIYIDAFTCGETDPGDVVRKFAASLGGVVTTLTVLQR